MRNTRCIKMYVFYIWEDNNFGRYYSAKGNEQEQTKYYFFTKIHKNVPENFDLV